MSDANAVWSPVGMTQEDFMVKDQCIMLDMQDNVIGFDNKYETHIFCAARPRAKLHRAFSVFLFNDKNELLLQQRAASKITFPDVWTNTCCSHPLSGFGGVEVDSPEDTARGSPQGVMRAAVRKLLHELGVPADQVPLEKFKFLTRLHYWAADVVTHGPDSPFGEHEIDYILFIKANVTCDLNPEEVSAVQYVTQAHLAELMRPESGLLWSPWFRIIAERFLPAWWADLDRTLGTDDLTDYGSIHRFDCTAEHLGGHGAAGPWLSAAGGAPGPEGDGWLAAVAANGGTPPPTEPMKPLLRRVEGTNAYKLDDGAAGQVAAAQPTAATGAAAAVVLSFAIGGAAQASAVDSLLRGEAVESVRSAPGFVKVVREASTDRQQYVVGGGRLRWWWSSGGGDGGWQW
jgi:isopentenyl-diphosphate delta-isomerase